MKKFSVILAVLLFVLVGCSSGKTVNEIKSTQVMTKIDNKESFLLYVASDTCSACLAFKPTLDEAIKNKGFDVYRIALDKENVMSDGKTSNPEGQKNVEKLLDTYLGGKVKVTPTLVYVEEGTVKSISEGALQYTQLLTWLSDNGIIKN